MDKMLHKKCFFNVNGDCKFLVSADEKCTGMCNMWRTWDKKTLKKFRIKKKMMDFYDLIIRDKRYRGAFGSEDEVQKKLEV